MSRRGKPPLMDCPECEKPAVAADFYDDELGWQACDSNPFASMILGFNVNHALFARTIGRLGSATSLSWWTNSAVPSVSS